MMWPLLNQLKALGPSGSRAFFHTFLFCSLVAKHQLARLVVQCVAARAKRSWHNRSGKRHGLTTAQGKSGHRPPPGVCVQTWTCIRKSCRPLSKSLNVVALTRPQHPALVNANPMNPSRYNPVSMALHWLLALLILGSLAVGLYMTSLPFSPTRLRHAARTSIAKRARFSRLPP